MREDLKESFNHILDVMNGTDGGVSFMNFRVFIENLDKMAASGDESAQEIVNIVHRFDRLIRYANKTAMES